MAEVKSSWFLPSHDGSSTDNISIPDERIRLFNVWFTPRKVAASGGLDLTLRTGSVSGDILMSLKIFNPGWGLTNPNLIIPGGGLLFEDGLYIVTGNDGSNHKLMAATVIYQSG